MRRKTKEMRLPAILNQTLMLPHWFWAQRLAVVMRAKIAQMKEVMLKRRMKERSSDKIYITTLTWQVGNKVIQTASF